MRLGPARTPQPWACIPPPQRLPGYSHVQPLPPAVCRIAEDGRPGFARERSIMWYTSSYLAGVMWLSLRLSPLYPASLTPLDPALCSATIAVYLYGFASPVRTVLVIQHVDSAALVLPHPLPWCCHGPLPWPPETDPPQPQPLSRPLAGPLPSLSLSLSPGPWLGPSPASAQAPGWAAPSRGAAEPLSAQ